MNLEEAENFISHDNCENCPYLVKNSEEFECDADERCFNVFQEASKTVISARDTRISELEKHLDELVDENEQIKAENERMRVCGNCGDDNCSYGSQHWLLCTANNNLKHWRPKEQKK